MNVVSIFTPKYNTFYHFASRDRNQFDILAKYLSNEQCSDYNELIYHLNKSIKYNLQINAYNNFHIFRSVDDLIQLGYNYEKWSLVEDKCKLQNEKTITKIHKLPKHVDGLIISKHYVIKF